MSARLEMMAAEYERRGAEQRAAAESFRRAGRVNYARASNHSALKYEREAESLRATIARNKAAVQT